MTCQMKQAPIQFRRGLVVGKFCPLHKGHELVIERAIASCDEVIVISYTKPEFDACPPKMREAWINAIFPSVTSLVLDDALLDQHCKALQLPSKLVPHNEEPDDIHREFVAWLCWAVLRVTVDAVFTSENYGDGFARVLSTYFQKQSDTAQTVKHLCVDIQRNAIPTSGTQLRGDPHRYRKFLSPKVYASFVKRVCILGGESSGKTSLCQALARRCETVWVPEYGRELWELNRGELRFRDMLRIGETQIDRENALLEKSNRYLFCDTSPLTTLFYSLSMFDKADARLREMASRSYDFIFLCSPDFPFVQDGTRKDDQFRQSQHSWYLSQLDEKAIPYHLLSGSIESRISTVLNVVAAG